MVRATLGVTIQRPVHDVFAVLANVENVPRWSRNTIEEKLLTPGPLRVGSRRRAVIRSLGGRTMTNVAEMVDMEEDRMMVTDIVVTLEDREDASGGVELVVRRLADWRSHGLASR